MNSAMHWKNPAWRTLLAACALVTTGTAMRRPGAKSESACVVVAPTDSAWHLLNGGTLQFTIRWNSDFQSHDLLWKNSAPHTVRLSFSADSLQESRTARATRLLFPGEVESLPGYGVRPSHDGVVCMQVTTAP